MFSFPFGNHSKCKSFYPICSLLPIRYEKLVHLSLLFHWANYVLLEVLKVQLGYLNSEHLYLFKSFKPQLSHSESIQITV